MHLRNIGSITATLNSFNEAFRIFSEGMRRRLRLGDDEKIVVIDVSPKVFVNNQEFLARCSHLFLKIKTIKIDMGVIHEPLGNCLPLSK
jgi:hypothetical protein